MQRNHLAVAAFSLLMILCASVSNSAMDALVSRYDNSIFSSLPPQARQWFDPRISYRNKWKDGVRSSGEAFFLSSTVLASLTDAWHFFKSVTIFFIYAAIVAPFAVIFRIRLYWWILIYVAVDCLRGAVFELFYNGILIHHG